MTRRVEGSVSLPGIEVEVVRPVWAALAFDDADGDRQALRLEGLPARIAQHEIDQMNGVFFLEVEFAAEARHGAEEMEEAVVLIPVAGSSTWAVSQGLSMRAENQKWSVKSSRS